MVNFSLARRPDPKSNPRLCFRFGGLEVGRAGRAAPPTFGGVPKNAGGRKAGLDR